MYWPALMLVAALSGVQGQMTAQSSVAPDFWECYLTPELLNRNNLPPSTMPVLIDIIRNIEDNPNVNMDLRQLAAVLLHTYRQDGIEYHQSGSNLGASSIVLPFAPTFHSFHRHRLLLTRLIPANLQTLGNNTLSSSYKCALHHMLSTTVDARVRGDENNCNRLSEYRALRTARSTKTVSDDVEILDVSQLRAGKNGQIRQYNPNDDVEITSYGGSKSARQLLGDSQCPLLDGVVETSWGAVSAGNLIAGIAAGAALQEVPTVQLTKGSFLSNQNVRQTVTNIYPATLSGDLAEAALIQGITGNAQAISIGAAGQWNSTQSQRHFMLQRRNNLEMTDPEIRGDIDGFVLGASLTSTLNVYSSLRLSQVLDMYYSPLNGVFGSNLRACNRRELSQTNIQGEELISQTLAFASALDTHLPLSGTILNGLDTFVSSAVSNFQTYASTNMNDRNCLVTTSTMDDFRPKTNLYLVLDASWPYQTVYPAISHILERIEVNKYGSSITLLSAFDGSTIVNTTFSLAEFHANYTLIRHQSLMTGVNLQNTYATVRERMQIQLRTESAANYVGGNSTVLLFLLNAGNIQNDFNLAEEARILNDTVPDLRVLYATSTHQFDNLWNLVRDMYADIFTLSLNSEGTNLNLNMGPLVDRINQVGRRVVNPLCGSEFVDQLSGSRQYDDFVDPGYINFYSVSPNYFYVHNDNRRIRVSRAGTGIGSLVVCHSRQIVQPRQNSSTTDSSLITCQNLASSGNVEISLQNACDDYWTIGSCPPLYFSVQSITGGAEPTSAQCTDIRVCRFPYNIRYTVQIEDLGCFSSGSNVVASVVLSLSALLLSLFRQF